MHPSSWQHAASVRLLTATATVAKLAFAIPECPQQLLDYLQPFIARLPHKQATGVGVKPESEKQNESTSSTNSMKAGWGTCSGGSVVEIQRQPKRAGAKQGQSSTVAPQVLTSRKNRPTGCSMKVRQNMRSCTDQTAQRTPYTSSWQTGQGSTGVTTSSSIATAVFDISKTAGW